MKETTDKVITSQSHRKRPSTAILARTDEEYGAAGDQVGSQESFEF